MRLSLSGLLDRLIAPAPAPHRVAWLRGAVFAHRGLHGAGIPENSQSAAAGAIARGFGIECDVQLSADGQAVVFHDATLERLTTEVGPVGERTAAQLGEIALGGSADTIPTLRRWLDMVDGRVPLLIEVKSPNARQVGAISRAVRDVLEGYGGEHAVMSFDPRVVRWFRVHAPETVRGLVVTEENDTGLRGRLRRHGALWLAAPDFLSYDIRDLPARFPMAQRARGLPLVCWTVRTPALLRRAREYCDAPTAEGAGLP